jgi:hypothetical protein
MEIKLAIRYGNMDDFDLGPPRLKFSIVWNNVSYALVFDKVGIELLRYTRGSCIYRTVWSFDWRRKRGKA